MIASVTNQTFSAKDGKNIFYYQWPAISGDIKGVVQIAHGFGEHAARYQPLAEVLQKNGFVVYANDHRGHGRTESPEDLGNVEGGNFWNKAVDDMYQFTQIIKKENPNKPIFLFGHSMGSLMTRDYIIKHADELRGALISGTVSYLYPLSDISIFLAKVIQFFHGPDKKSKLLKNLLFENLNKPFKPARTKFDWVSKDEKEVDKFIADPYRIEDFSVSVFKEIFSGLKKVNKQNHFAKTPKDLPIYLLSGDHDSASDMGKGLRKIQSDFENANTDLTCKIYPNGRHEMINEVNRQEVLTDIVDWINEKS